MVNEAVYFELGFYNVKFLSNRKDLSLILFYGYLDLNNVTLGAPRLMLLHLTLCPQVKL